MRDKVAVGDVLAGKYRVERVLGSGGMGVVVAARHAQLDVLVALKFMTDDALDDPDLVARFLREARAAARLRSEHVARVTDVGVLESGAPYQVMEYLEGSDLSAIISNEGPQPIQAAVEYIVQACEALEEAHRAGIVHRDIKPSNLFLTTRVNGSACVKVLDFGISKSDRLGGSSNKLHATRSRAVLGSPLYMAPEQMRASRGVDARADIWALGATLYELLTARVPFEAESILDLALQVAQNHPRPPRETRPEIPRALETIVLTCLEKERDHRYASAQSLASVLAPFTRGPGTVLRDEPREELSIEQGVAPVPPRTSAERASPGAPPPTRQPEVSAGSPTTTLPMTVIENPAAPAVRSGLRGWRTGAKVSWGRSHKSSSKRARVAWGAAAFLGLLAAGGAAAFLALRWHDPLNVSGTPTSLGTTVAAANPEQNSFVVATQPTSAAAEPASAHPPSTAPSTLIQTLSVTDLPTVVPRPVALPRVTKMATTPGPSVARSDAGSTAPTPKAPRAPRTPAPASSPDPLANPN